MSYTLSEMLDKYIYLSDNYKDYNSLLDVFIRMQQDNYVTYGKLQFVKDLKVEALTDLKTSKIVLDVFCNLEIVYEIKGFNPNDGDYTEYHIHKIIKNYFKLSDILYMIKNNIKYSTYDRMYRKEKLKEIFGDEFK